MARYGFWCGLVGVAGNIAGVAVLGPVPSAYRAGTIVAWAHEIAAAPGATLTSGVAFAIGLMALAGWALILTARLGTPAAIAGGAMAAAGAVLNAAGSLLPIVAAHHLPAACGPADHCTAVAVALLGTALSLDALFNLLLGVGLLAIGRAIWVERRALGALLIVAGLASVPVSLQIVSDTAARLLIVAGPLWLAGILWSSVLLARRAL